MAGRRNVIAVYIMASRRNGTLYVGMTSDLHARVWQHRTGALDGFARTYGCTQLVWFEQHDQLIEAIVREKRLKKWLRDWKLKLIEEANPDWRDLAADWFPENDPDWTPSEEPD